MTNRNLMSNLSVRSSLRTSTRYKLIACTRQCTVSLDDMMPSTDYKPRLQRTR